MNKINRFTSKAFHIPIATTICIWFITTGSLFSVYILQSPITISIADIGYMAGLLFAFAYYRSLEFKIHALIMAALALVVLLSGLYNAYSNIDFAMANFFQNYPRVVGLAVGSLIIPRLFRDVHHAMLARAILALILIHLTIIAMDSINLWPWPVNENDYAVTGLFLEPAWFGFWLATNLMLLGYIQWQTSHSYIPIWVLFLSIGMSFIVRSGTEYVPFRPSLSTVFLTATLASILFVHRIRLSAKQTMLTFRTTTMAGLIMLTLAVIAIVLTTVNRTDDNGSSLSRGIASLIDRISRYGEGPAMTDTSTRDRILGSWEFAAASLKDSPVFGTGLGSDNEKLAYERNSEEFTYLSRPGTWQVPASVLRSTGIAGALIVSSMIVYLSTQLKLRAFAFGWVLIGLVWGDSFSSFYWLVLFSGIGLSQITIRQSSDRLNASPTTNLTFPNKLSNFRKY